ncbi:nonstructural protein [Blackfly microvirus SF02]|uniref:Nonstructural protein n=1 Tax=Blackfly microvirus SF02 TaxID=2576452 RepID=A0A4P8PQ48_9VIRU|nr:nonstructural protein [Blackfly microvirus SF02]
MRLILCAVFDSKVGAYTPPFACKTKGEAIRSFSDACLDEKGTFIKHPSDFRLFYLGEYDDNSGMLHPVLPSPEPLIGADEVGG